MDFGIFTEQIRRGSSQGEAFGELFELVDAAETWGLDVVWLAEMLVNPTRSVLSAPLLVASWIVARTKRLRVGTAVQLLPLNHPLRVAGEVATLDHLSHGRFDFGVGRSGGPRAYDALGVPYEESQGRFFEALEIILSAWKGEPFSYEGKFYRFANATVTPRPYQHPHPPVRMAATTADTFPRVGRMGLPIFVGLRGMNIPELAAHVRRYRQARRGAGAGRPFHAAPRRAQPQRDRGGAESRWSLAEGARDAHLADSHASGDARVQIGSAARQRRSDRWPLAMAPRRNSRRCGTRGRGRCATSS